MLDQVLLQVLKSLKTNISSCIINNGVTSKYFSVGRGVRQGDPLSPYLFILAIELLSCAIREDRSIKGIAIHDHEIKIIQYADDSTCVVQDEHSANNCFALIDTFTKISGLKLSVCKSQAMWLGSKRHSKKTPLDIEWPDVPVKALGVYFSYDASAAAKKSNFEPKIEHLKTIWKSRSLTWSEQSSAWQNLCIISITFI